MEIRQIFVVGSGFMGSGIAQTALQSGIEVTLHDVSKELLEKAKGNIEKMFNKNIAKGRMTEEEKISAMRRLSLSDSLESASGFDMVIEAVYENVEVKKSIFKELSKIVRKDAILATNTSSISITDIASVVENPARFIGMHFFSPVPLMKLLEIVKGLATSDDTVEKTRVLGAQLGKVCVVCKDSPAFIVNRMLDPMINEAIHLVETGVASVEDIDTAMRFGLNHPMGPLELIDMAGIDIELAVMEVLYAETGDPKYRPSLLLRNMVRAGFLGRKTGKGFYVYSADGEKRPNPDI